jgi:hypothetical protein
MQQSDKHIFIGTRAIRSHQGVFTRPSEAPARAESHGVRVPSWAQLTKSKTHIWRALAATSSAGMCAAKVRTRLTNPLLYKRQHDTINAISEGRTVHEW